MKTNILSLSLSLSPLAGVMSILPQGILGETGNQEENQWGAIEREIHPRRVRRAQGHGRAKGAASCRLSRRRVFHVSEENGEITSQGLREAGDPPGEWVHTSSGLCHFPTHPNTCRCVTL